MSDPFPQVIVFDAVGTLIKPAEDVTATYQRMGRAFGSHLSRDEIRWRFRSSRKIVFDTDARCVASDSLALQQWRDLVEAVFGELADFDRLFEKLWDHYSLPASWQVFDDVQPALQMIERAGVDMAIASNFDSRLTTLCRRLETLDRIPDVFCSSDIGFAKPSMEFFTIVASRLNCPVNRLVMVGDDPEKDIVAAGKAGWMAVHVNRSKTDLPTCLRAAFPFFANP